MEEIQKNFDIITFSGWPGRIFHYPELPSTNTLLIEELRSGEQQFKNYDVVWADFQNQGKGRMAKKWIAPTLEEGQVLTFSVFLSLPLSLSEDSCRDIATLPQVVAWTWATLMQEAGASVKLKWPNDILCGGEKLAGFLAETIFIEEKVYMVLGMGINLSFTLNFINRLKEMTGREITSLEKCFPEEGVHDLLEPRIALERFLKKFHSCLNLWREDSFAPFVESWKQLSDLVGQRVTIHTEVNRERREVSVEDIAPNGHLIVRDGEMRKEIYFGEIEY